MSVLDRSRVLQALRVAWSDQTSSKWTRERPSTGQCSVTALVVQDLFGGTLLKTRVDEAWHFYNEVSGEIHDFTAEQFGSSIEYEHLPATREEAFRDTTPIQYEELQRTFAAAFRQRSDC
jgi:hypothetical protein